LVAVTEALGTEAPFGSSTRPVIVANAALCALAPLEEHSTKAAPTIAAKTKPFTPQQHSRVVLFMIPPVKCG
jgi:hypothetical protein